MCDIVREFQGTGVIHGIMASGSVLRQVLDAMHKPPLPHQVVGQFDLSGSMNLRACGITRVGS